MRKMTALIFILLSATAFHAQAQSCQSMVDSTIQELSLVGGTEVWTLREIRDTCQVALRYGEISISAADPLREIHNYIASWESMQKMLTSPSSSMKEEMQNNRPDLARLLYQNLVALRSAL